MHGKKLTKDVDILCLFQGGTTSSVLYPPVEALLYCVFNILLRMGENTEPHRQDPGQPVQSKPFRNATNLTITKGKVAAQIFGLCEYCTGQIPTQNR